MNKFEKYVISRGETKTTHLIGSWSVQSLDFSYTGSIFFTEFQNILARTKAKGK